MSMKKSIAILDLPLGSALTVDGQVLRLQRDDFVGIRDFPTATDAGSNAFHLIVARAAVKTEVGGGAGTTPVGFVLVLNNSIGDASSDSSSGNLALVKRYDATTEEVSSHPVDSTTVSNLEQQLLGNQLEPQRLINYSDIVSPVQQAAWGQATQFISLALLKAKKIQPQDKIVPGAYTEEDAASSDNTAVSNNNSQQDGASIEYPPIPVLQTNMAMARQSQHSGTKRYLAALPPSDRTRLFMSASPQALLLEQILQKYYHEKWQELLGDIQLSYLFFLHLHCLASLEHWRDLVAMVCLVPANEIASNYLSLYTQLLTLLAGQILNIDTDFFDDGGDDNFLLPSLQTLCKTTERIANPSLQSARTRLCQLLDNRFPNAMISSPSLQQAAMDSDMEDSDEDDDDEDTPVVVSAQDYEASLARSSKKQQRRNVSRQPPPLGFPLSVKQQYPVLFAAQMEQEDILMTCARALDEKTDVSLVREAADFLVEQVEPSSTTDALVETGMMMDE